MMISLAVVAERCGIGLAISAALLFIYDLRALVTPRRVTLALGLFVFVVLLVFRVSFAMLGAIAAASTAVRAGAQGEIWIISVLALGALAGTWAAAVLVQLIENVALLCLGRPPQRVQWWRSWKAKPARRSKATRGATD